MSGTVGSNPTTSAQRPDVIAWCMERPSTSCITSGLCYVREITLIKYLEDMWGDTVNVGDTVIASRPAGAGTTMLEYCEVAKINESSVSLRSITREGNIKEQRWGSPNFTLQKNRSSNKCIKIVKYRA